MEQRNNRVIIGVGLLTIAFALFYFNKPKKNKPKKNKEPKKVEQTFESNLPKRFIDDVKNMSLDELKTTISANKQLLADNNIDAEEREAVEYMLEYLNKELANKK
jgi:hypothetical protein